MDVERATNELTERKIVRRGLLAGIAALGAAAAMKLSRTQKAEAADGDGNPVLLGNIASDANGQSLTTETRIVANPGISTPVLQVTNGGNTTSARSAITAVLSDTGGTGGHALRAVCNDASGMGVYGGANDATGIGVKGESINGTGVLGLTSAGSSTASGVNGQAQGANAPGVRGSNSANGTGIKGVSNSSNHTADGDGSGVGVYGKAANGTGVRGESNSSVGVDAISNLDFAVRATSTAGAAIFGTTGGNGVAAVLANAVNLGTLSVDARNIANGDAIVARSSTNPLNEGDGAGIAVAGISGTGIGIDGRAKSSGVGVHGTSLSGDGVRGDSSTGGVGVRGFSSTSFGVRGLSNTGVGVEGQGFSAPSPGMRGVNVGNGTGVKGVSNTGGDLGADGTGSGIGVHGKSTAGFGVRGESTSAAGVSGFSVNQPGLDGTSTNSLGIRGTSTNFVGIVGISTNNHGLYGSTNGVNAYGIVAENLSGGPGLFVQGASVINGSLQVLGAKNAILKMADGTDAAVYCQESPEPYFEDFGRAQLVGGLANVSLEREFAQLVAGGDYMVYAHPEGDSNGVYVTQRGPGGFQVRENRGGTSNVPFTYRIVTKRKDIDGRRFARVDLSAMRALVATRAAITGDRPTVTPPTVVPPTITPQQNTAPQPNSPAPAPSPAPSPVPPLNPPSPADRPRGG